MSRLVLLLLGLAIVTTSQVTNVAVRSVQVKGALKCGNEVAKNVKAVLYRVPSELKKINEAEELDTSEISPAGLFELSGNTNGRPLNETDLNPVVRFYHRCDIKDDKKKDQTRSFQVKVSDDFVTLGKTAKKTFDFGTLNLELEYPNEGWVKNKKKQ